jgi:hypothetical protein
MARVGLKDREAPIGQLAGLRGQAAIMEPERETSDGTKARANIRSSDDQRKGNRSFRFCSAPLGCWQGEIVMQAVALSKNAVAVLRLRVRGVRLPLTDRRLEAYRELAVAGIMREDGADFRFAHDGWLRREELLSADEADLRSREERLPARIDLSRAARKTLAGHLAGDKQVTDANREAYRELAGAGIMVSVGTFAKGDDCVFQLTHQGWERRHEFQRRLPRFSASAIARSLSLAVSRIARGVSAAR